MIQTLLSLLSTGLLLAFVACCVASGMLQLAAWRHAREGVGFSPRALLDPEPYFDEVGLRQMILSKRLLTLGGVAYLGFGALMLFGQVVG